ncbi:MAG: hypothetical protein CL930_14330 [Deltaproteobacteria bacterium]|nr:hypothetical protein [Deltaproteobacteria bacterium]|tara:strand:- start:94 stop:900 length:807 start_codon:yes stop_codon:yes gene_type:complete
MLQLRLDKAETALQMGRFDQALIEAEELLDDHPSHRRGLEIAGAAALTMGDAVMALEALNRFVELHPPDARILQALAVARFEAVDYPGTLAAAEQSTALDSSIAAAWYYQGLALERLGRIETAQERFSRAEILDQVHFQVPSNWKDLSWEGLLSAAIGQLPEPFQIFYDSVDIRWNDFPDEEDLLENYPPLSPFTDALYRGHPPEDADPWNSRPKYVALFRGNLSRPSPDDASVISRIHDALVHEAMHWLGIQSESSLPHPAPVIPSP